MRTLTLVFCLSVIASALAQGDDSPREPRRGGGRGFGGPIELNADDVAAFPAPPDGFDQRRDDIPHGETETIEYDSTTVGTRRKMLVYTPPGYSTDEKYPVLYLLHGIGGDETEWERFAEPGVMLDNLIADGLVVPMIVVMPNGRAQEKTGPRGTSSHRLRRSRHSNVTCWTMSYRPSSHATALTPIARTGRWPDCRWEAASR